MISVTPYHHDEPQYSNLAYYNLPRDAQSTDNKQRCGIITTACEPEAYVTASRQYVAQSNQWSLKELILQVIVQDSTDQQQFVEDDCTFAIRSLRLQGAKCRSNKLSLSSSISTELNLTLFKWIRATERKQTNAMITLPVYLNATRSELLFTIELEAADNSLNEFDFYERGKDELATQTFILFIIDDINNTFTKNNEIFSNKIRTLNDIQ
ncbi:unnamed protein product [Rotaria magnacalcarata]|uniref:Dynein heavy chain C-terminal domain-containing protein n=1 Tax=Rotaria magnacalcarata TaxID=392030 RepID=A0A816XPN7_9BILA|nr:unnamed protein product [Rotaria magnacalcarata]CAF3986355.1 unnamed protein product [Rotaria magnacalcarata]